MIKKFVWIFAISIAVFLACTYFVTRKVEGPASSTEIVREAQQKAARGPAARPYEKAPAARNERSPPSASSSSGSGATSALAVIQVLSGFIAALSGLLGAINAFRRKGSTAS